MARGTRNAVCMLILVASFISCKKTNSRQSSTLENELRESLKIATYDPTKISPDVIMLVTSPSGRRFFRRDDLEKFITHAKAKHEGYDPADIKILHIETSPGSRYAGVTYTVGWNITIDNKTRSTEVVAHEIWEHQMDGWHRLFSAMDSKPK